MPRLVPVVQADVDNVRIRLRHLDQLHAHTLQPRQVARRRSIRSRRWLRCRIDSIDIEVLVSVVILRVNDELAVPRPQIARHRALGLRRQQPRRAERLVHRLHIDVAGVLPRLQECDVVTVWRYLRRRDLRIPENQLAIDNRGQPCAATNNAGIMRQRTP